uniref:Uncharacterized protein n=1 Tax=Arundo donax TaxID=35708 RepID=A0A0A9E2Q4_ARUDO
MPLLQLCSSTLPSRGLHNLRTRVCTSAHARSDSAPIAYFWNVGVPVEHPFLMPC